MHTQQGKIAYLTQEELRGLLAVIQDQRDRALFYLAYHHGLRASEVSLLQRQNIDAPTGHIYIHRLKGSISKTYPIQPEDLRLIRSYLQTHRDGSPYLFITNRGMPLERRSYWDLMQKYGELAEIPKEKRRFQALRNSVAVHLLEAGAEITFVQDRLGHANLQNTSRYLRYVPARWQDRTSELFASDQVL